MADPGDVPRKPAGVSERRAITEGGGGVMEKRWMEGKRVLILVLAWGLLCSDAAVDATSMGWLHSERRAIEIAQTTIQSPNTLLLLLL